MKTPKQKSIKFCYETGLGKDHEKGIQDLLTGDWKNNPKCKSKIYYFRLLISAYLIKKLC